MRRDVHSGGRSLAIGVALAVCACSGSSGSAGPAGPVLPPPQYDFAPLTAYIRTTLDATPRATGAALVLVQDGHVIYAEGFDGVTPDSEAVIASAAKWLTAITILASVERGEIDLDDRMDEHLPSSWWTGAAGQDKERITFRQLLSLTSGIQTHHPCIYREKKTLQTCMEDISGQQLLAPPGEAFIYSQAAFTVAGAALERATGRSWGEVFERNVAGPLGLTGTRYLGTEWDNPQLGDGGVSTVREYARIVQMIADGGVYQGRRILSGRLVDEMLRDQTVGARLVYSPRLPELRYGLGVWRDRVDPASGDALLVSSPGSRGLIPWYDLERSLVGVLYIPPHLDITSAMWGGVWQRVREIVPAR